MPKSKISRGHFTTRGRRRKLRKEIRETIICLTVAMIGAVFMVGLWIGSVIQTSERISEALVEVQG